MRCNEHDEKLIKKLENTRCRYKFGPFMNYLKKYDTITKLYYYTGSGPNSSLLDGNVVAHKHEHLYSGFKCYLYWRLDDIDASNENMSVINGLEIPKEYRSSLWIPYLMVFMPWILSVLSLWIFSTPWIFVLSFIVGMLLDKVLFRMLMGVNAYYKIHEMDDEIDRLRNEIAVSEAYRLGKMPEDILIPKDYSIYQLKNILENTYDTDDEKYSEDTSKADSLIRLKKILYDKKTQG